MYVPSLSELVVMHIEEEAMWLVGILLLYCDCTPLLSRLLLISLLFVASLRGRRLKGKGKENES